MYATYRKRLFIILKIHMPYTEESIKVVNIFNFVKYKLQLWRTLQVIYWKKNDNTAILLGKKYIPHKKYQWHIYIDKYGQETNKCTWLKLILLILFLMLNHYKVLKFFA